MAMKSSRRHPSLIPLSREHHYALMLCLQIHRGVADHRDDLSWLRQKASSAVDFFASDLVQHFKAEEDILFPSMKDFDGASPIISELLADHRKIESMVEEFSSIDDNTLADRLHQFADVLEAHIRREERELFPLFESKADEELENRVEIEITKMIGTALQPRNPELLK